MKITLNTLFVLLLFTATSFSQSGQKNFIDQPYIEVSGQVEIEITPNEIYLRVELNENDKKGRVSIEKQENRMLAKLRQCDIDIEKQLSVEDFSGIYKRKFFGENKVSKIKHYQLLIYDGKTLAKIYQELDAIDVSNISIIKVDHSEIETYKRETKLKALKLAKQKAEDYANAINQGIGKALYIQESSNIYRVSNMRTNNVSKSYDSQESIANLDIKKIKITENVLAKFILD